MADATWNRCRLGASCVYTIQQCTSLQCHFIRSHMCSVHVCLAVTCHLHFWQNDRELLRAAAVTRGWNEYRNESAQKVDRDPSARLCALINSAWTIQDLLRPILLPSGTFTASENGLWGSAGALKYTLTRRVIQKSDWRWMRWETQDVRRMTLDEILTQG